MPLFAEPAGSGNYMHPDIAVGFIALVFLVLVGIPVIMAILEFFPKKPGPSEPHDSAQ